MSDKQLLMSVLQHQKGFARAPWVPFAGVHAGQMCIRDRVRSMNEMEQQIVGMISAAGDSKAKAFEALKKVKESKYDEARALLQDCLLYTSLETEERQRLL